MEQMTREQEVFGKLLVTANQIQRFGDSVTAPLTLKQWLLLIVLAHLETPSPTLNQLAEASGSSRQNVAVMARKLEDKGYLTLTPNPQDQRSLLVQLTGHGAQALSEVASVGNEVLAELFEGFTAEQLETTLTVIQLLLERTAKKDN